MKNIEGKNEVINNGGGKITLGAFASVVSKDEESPSRTSRFPRQKKFK